MAVGYAVHPTHCRQCQLPRAARLSLLHTCLLQHCYFDNASGGLICVTRKRGVPVATAATERIANGVFAVKAVHSCAPSPLSPQGSLAIMKTPGLMAFLHQVGAW